MNTISLIKKLIQLVHMIPKILVEASNEYLWNSVNLAIYNHNIIKNCQLYALDSFISKELYNISIFLI